MKRKLLIALGILLALIVLVVGGAWWWVHSEAGGRFIRDKVLAATKDALAGNIEVASLELSGDRLTLRGLKLFTPEGDLVAEIKEVRASVTLTALLKKTIQLREVAIDGPTLHLVSDDRGLNLTRAIAAKHPAPDPTTPAKPGGTVKIEVEQLTLGQGFVSFDADDQHFAFDALEITGHASVATSPLHVDSELAVDSKLIKPMTAPLSIRITTSSPATGAAIDASVVLSLGDDHLEASGSWPTLTLTVKNTSVQSKTLKVFVPAWPLQPTVSLTADLTDGKGTVHVEAGHSKVNVDAAWANSFSTVSNISLEATDVDLAELLGAGKPSRIHLTAKGNLSDVKSLTGKVEVEGEWATPAKKKLAQVSVEVNANHGDFFLPKLAVAVPGITLGVNGKATTKKLNVSGVMEITDLSKIKSTVHEFVGVDLPAMTGKGHLNVNADGTLTHPSVNLSGALSGLNVSGISVQTLDLDVHVPDVQRPFDSDGDIDAKQVKVGETALDELKLSLSTRGRIVDAQISTKGLGDLVLSANGTLDEDQNGLLLNTLGLTSSQGEWSMEAPTKLTWSPVLELQPMKIQSGSQRLELAAKKQGSKLTASVNIVTLDLAKVPRAIAPEKWGLAGLLTLNATAKGTLPRPDIEAKVELSNGAASGFTGVSLNAEGGWRDQRAVGQFAVKTPLGNAKGEVNVDVDAVVNERADPVSGHVDVTEVDLAKVATFFKQELPVTAQVTAHLDIGGTADKPHVKVTVESPEVTAQFGDQPPLVFSKVDIEVLTRDTGDIGATVSATTFGGSIHVDATTPLTVRGLRKQLPTVASLKTMPVTGTLDVSAISVEAIRDSGFLSLPSTVQGRLGLQAQVSGTLEAPRATVTVTAKKVAYPPLDQVEASATVTANATTIELKAMVTEKGQPLVKADGVLSAPIATVENLDALGPQAVKLTATLFPLDLKTVVPSDSDLSGIAGATVTLGGTLDAPKFNVTGSIGQLAYSKTSIGSARFEIKGGGAHNTADVTIGGMGQDDLKVHGSVDAEIGLAAFRRGLTPTKYPVDVALKSNNFDLAFFSGITPVVRVIGGKLTMNATMQGTIGNPKLDGDAHWVNGSLNLSGFGNYRDIELQAKANNSLISLSKLKASSGAGWASINAEATRTSPTSWRLVANGQTEKFPIVVDDQPVAIATLKLDLNGDFADQFLNIKQLSLPQVLVELPDIRRKDLQNLDRPSDIVIVRGGSGDLAKRARDLEKKKEKKKADGSSFSARAVINAQQRIQVKSSDVDIELGLSDGFHLEYANNVQLYGDATVKRGKLSVLGRDFVVQQGSQARFAGAATEPYVNVTAVYTNNKSDDKTKVTVNVVGRGTAITLKVSSEPPLSESEIYTLLATGRPALSRGGGSSMTPSQAASVVGSALAAQAKTVIAKNVPIDVLDFESGDNFSGVKLNVGKYLTDTVFVGYSLNPGADTTKGENPHTVRLEYQVTHNWSLEASAGTAPAADADVVWSRDF